ncbi:MAG TPA: hypothetical protein VF941_17160 [Clostridia bacterium]
MAERKFRIADAANTYNPALNLIREKGYKIYLLPSQNEELYGDYWAIKDGSDFIASDPLRLLALINLWEEYGDEWRSKKYENILDETENIAFPRNKYEDLNTEQFKNLIDYLKDFFEAIDAQPEQPITRQSLYNFFTYPSKE